MNFQNNPNTHEGKPLSVMSPAPQVLYQPSPSPIINSSSTVQPQQNQPYSTTLKLTGEKVYPILTMMVPPPPLQPVQMGSSDHRQYIANGIPMNPRKLMVIPLNQYPLPQTSHQNPPTPQPFINATVLCRFGVEFVQEIVSRMLEVFQLLRTVSPNSMAHPDAKIQQEKKMRLLELSKTFKSNFSKLRLIYEKMSAINQRSLSLENREISLLGTLIPFKEDSDDDDIDEGDNVQSSTFTKHQLPFSAINRRSWEARKSATEGSKLQALENEYLDLVELNQLKSRQMQEIIEKLRKLVWSVNTMLAVSQQK